VLIFVISFCIRRYRPSRYHDGVIFPDDDVRENIIHYDEEGVGKNSLRSSYTTVLLQLLQCSFLFILCI